jgi:hypothetical protein
MICVSSCGGLFGYFYCKQAHHHFFFKMKEEKCNPKAKKEMKE